MTLFSTNIPSFVFQRILRSRKEATNPPDNTDWICELIASSTNAWLSIPDFHRLVLSTMSYRFHREYSDPPESTLGHVAASINSQTQTPSPLIKNPFGSPSIPPHSMPFISGIFITHAVAHAPILSDNVVPGLDSVS